jgi:hypothetical protein
MGSQVLRVLPGSRVPQALKVLPEYRVWPGPLGLLEVPASLGSPGRRDR